MVEIKRLGLTVLAEGGQDPAAKYALEPRENSLMCLE